MKEWEGGGGEEKTREALISVIYQGWLLLNCGRLSTGRQGGEMMGEEFFGWVRQCNLCFS